MLTRFRNGVVLAVALTTAAIAATPPQSPAPQGSPDLSPAALARRIELVREEYAGHKVSAARDELATLVDLVKAARETEAARPRPAVSGGILRAGRDVAMPDRLEGDEPEYPIDAAKKGITGYVAVDFVIGKSGKPRDIRVAHSIPTLDRAVLDAVRHWRFAAPNAGGRATDVEATVVLPFVLRRETPPGDELDLARFFVERADYREAETPLGRALATIGREANCSSSSGDVLRSEVAPGEPHQEPGLIADSKPVYPQIAMNAKVQGSVLLEGIVELDGRLDCLRLIKSVPLLDQAALDAAGQFRFKPAAIAEKPVRMFVNLQIDFGLRTARQP